MLESGDIINCIVGIFSKKKRYCVVISATEHSIKVLPITSYASEKDLCLCFGCDSDCKVVELTREDTNKNFTLKSYLVLTSYEVPSECCTISNIRHHTITKALRSKLKQLKIKI